MIGGIAPAAVDVILQEQWVMKTHDRPSLVVRPGAIGVDVERADEMEAKVEVVPRRERIAGNLSLDLETALLGVGVHGILGHPELHAQREPRARINAMNREVLGSDLLFSEDAPGQCCLVDFRGRERLTGQRAVDSRQSILRARKPGKSAAALRAGR